MIQPSQALAWPATLQHTFVDLSTAPHQHDQHPLQLHPETCPATPPALSFPLPGSHKRPQCPTWKGTRCDRYSSSNAGSFLISSSCSCSRCCTCGHAHTRIPQPSLKVSRQLLHTASTATATTSNTSHPLFGIAGKLSIIQALHHQLLVAGHGDSP